jgi:3-oxoacyl-[acyl-carrier-protein] synthase-1
VSARVVITGMGLVCAAGREVGTAWRRVCDGPTAIGAIGQWDTSGWKFDRAGEIADFDARTLVPDRKLHKLIGRTDMLGLYAADRAIESAGWTRRRESIVRSGAAGAAEAAERDESTGVFVGSGGSSYRDQYDFLPLLDHADGDLRRFGEELARFVHPMWLLRTLPNNVLCHVGIRYGFRGPNSCVVNHSTSGALALLEAFEAVRHGQAERVVAIAHQAPIEPQAVHYFAHLGLLAEAAVRPFDRRHDGALLGEGAAAVCLEREECAHRDGVPILGEIAGGGCVSEAGGLLPVQADGDGVERSVRLALDDAGLAASEVGAVFAHGNGTPASDISEAIALRRVFGTAIPPVTSFKWAIGHTLAASALIDTVLGLESLRRAIVPGINTFEELDPRCGELPVSAAPVAPRGRTGVVVGRGFAGVDTALVIRAAPDGEPDGG